MLLYFSFSLQVPDAACWLSLLARAAGPLLQTLFKLGGHTQCWGSEISCKSGNFEWGGNYRFVGQFLFVIRKNGQTLDRQLSFQRGKWNCKRSAEATEVENTRELIAQAKKEALRWNSFQFWDFLKVWDFKIFSLFKQIIEIYYMLPIYTAFEFKR